VAEPADTDGHQGVLEGFSILGIRRGFSHYRNTILGVARDRLRYADIHLRDRPRLLADSIAACVYGLLLAFLLYTPVILIHGLGYSKVEYLLQSGIRSGALIFILHGAMRVARGQGSLRQTASVCLSMWSVTTPLLTLLALPSSLAVPIPQDFGEADVAITMESAPQWAIGWMLLVSAVMGFATLLCLVAWLSSVHRISMLRVAIVGVAFMMPATWLLTTYVYPALQPVVEFIAGIGDLIL
jgi:hypothetical protein